MTISDIRRELKDARLQLTPGERAKKSLSIRNRLLKQPLVKRAQSIAIYLTITGEVETDSIIEALHQLEKAIYLPVINTGILRRDPMLFCRFLPGETELRPNRLGLLEPAHRIGECVRGIDLDLVCTPLVGFNESLDRIGMGGGYYDRCFATRGVKKTKLLGIAFDCQEAKFEPAAHDVALDMIVTESRLLTASQ